MERVVLYVRGMKAVFQTTILAMFAMSLAACSGNDSSTISTSSPPANANGGDNDSTPPSNGSGPPPSIQPQPLPDDSYAAKFDSTSIKVTSGPGGVSIAGIVKMTALTSAPTSSPVAAYDATTPTQTITQVTSDPATGEFAITLPAAAPSDRIFLFFPPDTDLSEALMLNPAATPIATPLCLAFDGGYGLSLPATTVNVATTLTGTFLATCGGAIAIDHVAYVGGNVSGPSPSTFSIPLAGASPEVSFAITSLSDAAWTTYVVLSAGDDRYVVAISGSGD